jgi:hypothetical protein
MRDRVEDDGELGRQLEGDHRLLSRLQLDRFQRQLLDQPLEIVGQVDPGAPEDLPGIFDEGEGVGIVGGDPAHARGNGERHLHHLVQRGLVTGGAQRAAVGLLAHGLERGVGVQHASAARAEHVPRHLEQTEAGGVQEAADHPVLVEAVLPGEVEDVDAVELEVLALGDEALDGRRHLGIGGPPQHVEERLGSAHVLAVSPRIRSRHNPAP